MLSAVRPAALSTLLAPYSTPRGVCATRLADVHMAGNTAYAATWHRQRRRQMLEEHGSELRALISEESDFWVFSLGLVLVPLYGYALVQSPDASLLTNAFVITGLGSLRANWAIYCGHAISHGRWRRQLGRFGSARFNAALAMAHVGHVFQVLPSYWLFHHSHHTKLGALSLTEARTRAKRGLPTDGDLAIATRLFSPPARRYTVFVDGQDQDDADTVKPLARQSEIEHQLMSVLVHALAPVGFAGYLVAALRAGEGGDRTLRRSLAVQAAAQLGSFIGVGSLSLATGSASPMFVYLLSSLYWLSPLNPNSLWTSPHISKAGSSQPTVSFYTPDGPLGRLLDAYMGWENYHVEHHDFPELPMYVLPKLRNIAPEMYDDLLSYRVCDAESLRETLAGDFYYACQDRVFGEVDDHVQR